MPEPFVIEVAIAPQSKSDAAALLAALDRLVADDPAIGVSHDPDSGQIVVGGTGEAELDLSLATLRQKSGIAIALGAPQVAYRETLTRRIETDYTHKTRAGASGLFARVRMIFEPHAAGSTFVSKIAGGAVPEAFVSGVAVGVASVMRAGILAGFPVVDVAVTLVDGAYHDTESSVQAFEIAARAAFRQALRDGGARLLEPIMALTVTMPEDYLGFVTGDTAARRGRVERVETRADAVVVHALVPLSNTFGYGTQLRSGTQGRGTFTLRFDHYAPVGPCPGDDGPAAPAIALRA